MRILITGSKGFIGSHLVDYFSEKHKVLTYDKKDQQDVRNYDQLKKATKDIDCIIHLAAIVSVPESVEKPADTFYTNVLGTLNVLNAALENNVKKVILASSAAIYGNDPVLPKTETSLIDIQSPYAETKIQGERMLKFFCDNCGLDTCSLRIFNAYGPRQDPNSQYAAVIPAFIKRALENKSLIIYGDGEQTRDFIFVKDIARAIELAIQNKTKGEIFNIALGRSISINELANKIVNLSNSNSKIIHQAERPGDIKHSLADISKARNHLGFNIAYNLDKGLNQTIDYFSR